MILFENDELIGIDKPSGLMVHADGRSKEKTLADWVVERFPQLAEVGEHTELTSGEVVERPGIVHRLDRETSGAMVIAKTQESFLNLKEQFQNHTVKKTYRAFVQGLLYEERGIINRPIGKSRSNFRLWSAGRGAKGTLREARTDFRVLLRGKEDTYVEAFPKTGRTHQIRVHFKAIHHPVIGDSLYGGKSGAPLGLNRLALHSKTVVIQSLSGKEVTIEAPLPPSFLEAEAMLREQK